MLEKLCQAWCLTVGYIKVENIMGRGDRYLSAPTRGKMLTVILISNWIGNEFERFALA
jgi:hypothetical protein